jgi:hypothetical protein
MQMFILLLPLFSIVLHVLDAMLLRRAAKSGDSAEHEAAGHFGGVGWC